MNLAVLVNIQAVRRASHLVVDGYPNNHRTLGGRRRFSTKKVGRFRLLSSMEMRDCDSGGRRRVLVLAKMFDGWLDLLCSNA